LGGMSEAQLDQTAVQALVSGFAPRVSLVTNGLAGRTRVDAPMVSQSNRFDGEIGYVRVQVVRKGLANAVRDACKKLAGTNKLDGVILDLRYAGGDDYASAASTAELFVKKDQLLLDWGAGMERSKEDSDSISLPVAVLVNRQTTGAAEALAGVLRQTGSGLILGNRTAGQAMIAQEFPLKNGDRLRVATAPIRLGDGTALSADGLKPDIAVEVAPGDERAYYADAYQVPKRAEVPTRAATGLTNQASGTNRAARRPRFNEAELVRERREGISEADVTALGYHQPDKPMIADPALARALDLLKGLAVVRQSHS